MSRDDRYDPLFEPVRIGPVTAPNRFYQVPHCNGMGVHYPSAMAAMRGIKAEGGWGVVCTEECDFHHSAEVSPAVEARLWSALDVPVMARMVESVKRHGALAGCELVYGGAAAHNRQSREVPLAPGNMPVMSVEPGQARAMDRRDIRDFRRWHRQGAVRAREAGFDIVYVYAGHNLCLLQHFISRRYNQRHDEYGGSIENRTRLLREVIEDTKEAVGAHMAVAVRFAVDELAGDAGLAADGDGRAVVELLADYPDLWDVNLSDWANDSQTARYAQEGYQEEFVRWVKQVTRKPVVGVGRYTSPDRMLCLVKKGVLDFIGAARPSIADPFLPNKIAQGRLDDIRECIGCNICVSGDFGHFPMRCTQNPTMGEEWRRGWHPERCEARAGDHRILVVGGGPAGLEAARMLGERGYEVTLAEAGATLGGHVPRVAALPGLATWQRVIDYRLAQLGKMPNVAIYRHSELGADEVLEFGFDQVALATGSSWRRDGRGRRHPLDIPRDADALCLTPDDILRGVVPAGPVLVYDDDHYFMASVLAEKLVADGLTVTYATPAPDVATWTHHILEQGRTQARLLEIGVNLELATVISRVDPGEVEFACVHSGRRRRHACGSVVLVTMREPADALYHALAADDTALSTAGIKRVARIGDCLAPGLLAAAVYAGHRYARELDAGAGPVDAAPFRREVVTPAPAGV